MYFIECDEKSASLFFTSAYARMKMLIFSPHEIKYIWYLPKTVNFLFILYSKENYKELTCFMFVSHPIRHFYCVYWV